MFANIEYYNLAKESLSLQGDELNRYPHFFPTALRVALMIQDGVYFVKSSEKSLKNRDFYKEFSYPFVYKYIHKSDKFIICSVGSCSKENDSFDEVKEYVKKIEGGRLSGFN